MSKKDVLKAMQEEMAIQGYSYSLREIEGFVDAYNEMLYKLLSSGSSVQIPKVGTFKVSLRAERTCRNPKSGVSVPVPAQFATKFQVSNILKTKLQQLRAQ
ncbi:HU family DNA-binding protein [Vogesella sp. XCS3]|uniref:HU family DNA-binding protein n=1 Tax=Vogesella sp. XCS3 TaxID=2877939 RepID=UPI001D0A08C8|nr:HU family DNA-binding protein [Vogesella sp. XCS3]UDM18847.1 HU family DNA-binding protein [Vogesella sp. XCS3]